MSFSRNADSCEPFPASPFGSCSRPRNDLTSLSTHRVVDHPCIFMRRHGVPITHASAADRVERRRHGRTLALPCGQSVALNSAGRGRRLREARHGEQPQSSRTRASIGAVRCGPGLVRHDRERHPIRGNYVSQKMYWLVSSPPPPVEPVGCTVRSSCESPLCGHAVGASDVGGRFLALVLLDGLADQLACPAAVACQVCDFRSIERGIGWVPRIV
jgi:hypothetical protein